ncbi:MAG TPA: hypothetical protein VFQ61_12765 [Polyangiaceae bacterium]|nr:hypothetical protein [Polyangiaceae bacterium]
MRAKTILFLVTTLVLSACGGGSKPAEEPSTDAGSAEKSAPKKSESESESDAEETSKTDAKSEKKDESESSTSGPKVSRTPKDMLTAPDIIFMFSFNGSDMKEKAEQECDKKAKDDPKKRAQCMSKAKEKIEADGMRFLQEKGKWYWLVVRRKGKTLVNLHKVPFEFGKETDHSIVLTPSGKDEGTQRTGSLGETTIEVPNEYQIVIQDPTHGKMVYEAKIGITGG